MKKELWTIRQAVASDAGPIAKVHAQSYYATYQGILPSVVFDSASVDRRAAFWKDTLSGNDPPAITLVACNDNEQVVGFASGGQERTGELPCDGELYAIYLAPHAQRQGIGAALVHSFAAELRKAGFRAMGVWVLEANSNRRFYELLGARRAARKEIERGGKCFAEIGYVWDDLDGCLFSRS